MDHVVQVSAETQRNAEDMAGTMSKQKTSMENVQQNSASCASRMNNDVAVPLVGANTLPLENVQINNFAAPLVDSAHVPLENVSQLAAASSFTAGDTLKASSNFTDKKSKKSIGGFRHFSRNLKRVARIPEKDRRKIVKILLKQSRERKARRLLKSAKRNGAGPSEPTKSSSNTTISSVNKDWEHWVSLQVVWRRQQPMHPTMVA